MKNPSTGILMLLLSVFLALEIQAQQAAFPGAEGHGMYTSGGRGGRVIKVTNLDDSGDGSLRAAVEASGPRIIVFDTSGTIQLKSRLVISNDSITIAGQTAPGDGICIRDYSVNVDADNVIIRFMRFRLGDEAGQVDDAIGGRGCNNVIIDHCSMSWSTDECVSFYGNRNFTMQWCLIGESLRNSVHEKGPHGYGGIWGGEEVSFHHNLLANHSSRNPRFCGSRYTNTPEFEHVDFRNNVIYNWEYNSAYGAEGGRYNMVNNYYKYGPATDEDVKNRIIHADRDNGENAQVAGVHGYLYVNGNHIFGNDAISENNWNGGVEWSSTLNEEDLRADKAFDDAGIFTESAGQAYAKIIEYVGASLFRDTVDERTIHDLKTGTATITDGGRGSVNGIIDTQEAVGGWPVLNSLPPLSDSDDDGMPDDWELAKGLDPNDPLDGNGDRDHDEYTNIEEYINSLALNYYDTYPFINTVKPRENEIFIAEGDTSIHVEAFSKDYNGGSVVRMELFLDEELMGSYDDSIKIITLLENVPPGMHRVVVKTTDDSAHVSVDTTTFFIGTREVGITVEESPNGRVVLDPPGGIYSEGINVQVTAVPDEGYLFHGWIKDLETSHRSLQIPTAKDISIKPVFVKDPEKKSIWSHPVKINFQPEEDYAIPEGYIADFGGAYSEKLNGYTYGWMEEDNPFNGLNMGESGAWKTFRYFEYSGNTYSWGIELPRGSYRIRLGLAGMLYLGWPTETELKINVEGILVDDNDGADLLDEHILDSIPVLDGQLTLTSVENSRICFIEIELLELAVPRKLSVENGQGDGDYYPDLEEDILVIADPPQDGLAFHKWTGDTTDIEDVYASSTFVSMPDTAVVITATYKEALPDSAYYLIVVNGTGSGFYPVDARLEISAPDTLAGGFFSHWEYDCARPVSFDGKSQQLIISMPDANAVFEPVYEIPAPGEGDIYQAEEASWDEGSTTERYHKGYFGTAYVNFKDPEGSWVQFNSVNGKEGGSFSIKLRYSLNDRAREGVVMVNGVRDTLVMTQTESWTDWNELEVRGILEAGSGNTIRIETTGDDLGYLDQIALVKLNTTGLEPPRSESILDVRCYPNPISDYATISFVLEASSEVSMELYDLQGRRVKVFGQGHYPIGKNKVSLSKEDLHAGLYFLRVVSDQNESKIKVLIN